MIKRFKLVVVILLMATTVFAKKKDKDKGNYSRVPPKYILVQLSTETNRKNALMKAGRTADLEVLKKDAAAVMALTRKDFKENFNYCPIYFFYDTDNQAILNRQFDVLMDGELKKAENVSITDTNYLIVYFGFPQWQTKERKLETTKHADMGGQPYGDALVFCNYQMKQVGYTYELRGFFIFPGKITPYNYESKFFRIGYRPVANDFDKRMKEYARKYAQKQKAKEEAAKL